MDPAQSFRTNMSEVPPGWVPPAVGTWTVDVVSFGRAAKNEKGLPDEALQGLKREMRPIYGDMEGSVPEDRLQDPLLSTLS